MRKIKLNSAFTLAEVLIASFLLLILLLSVYNLFSSEVGNIKTALEHVGINENARKFYAVFGNDIRNSNWLDYPELIERDKVNSLKPATEGRVCVLRRQFMDFSVKPPNSNFMSTQLIEYYLHKDKTTGERSLYRRIIGSKSINGVKQHEKKICGGVGELLVFATLKKPPKSGFLDKISKDFVFNTPYTEDGTGPYLLHVYISFIRPNKTDKKDKSVIKLRTCFNIRGKLNGVVP